MMRLENLSKSFYHQGQEIHLFNQINLNLPQMKKIAIVGKSGSGKSTLLSVIAGLEPADQGSLFFDEKNLNQFSRSSLVRFRAEKIGIIFQQFHLVSTLTAKENVLLPLKLLRNKTADEQESLARQWLNRVGLSHREDHFPHQMSGGECQRVAIARALVHSPDLVLADEPSGNLDEETGEMVMDTLFSALKHTNSSLVLVTHDKELANKCDEVWLLEKGSLHLC